MLAPGYTVFLKVKRSNTQIQISKLPQNHNPGRIKCPIGYLSSSIYKNTLLKLKQPYIFTKGRAEVCVLLLEEKDNLPLKITSVGDGDSLKRPVGGQVCTRRGAMFA